MDDRNVRAWTLIALVVAGLLSGCSQQTGNMQSLHQFVLDAPKTNVSIPPLPKSPTWKPLAYQNAMHLNPFTSFSESLLREEAQSSGSAKSPGQHGPLQPLQKYPLASLRLTGMVRTSSGQLWAIMETPKHQVYRATMGSAIGNEDGHITAMHQQEGHNSITVTQYIRNLFGKYQRQATVLLMSGSTSSR